ncbi:MAG TPA: ABC transporter permease, partial [Vicinamibacterales bacterium]|nr:ABC transporter permease [Vicinamibacterales bacterium]
MTLSAIAYDCRIAVRRLLGTPGYSALLIVALALGIGAHAAVFGVASSVLYPDNPYAEGRRVVYVELHKQGRWVPLLERHAASLATQTQWFDRIETVRVSQIHWRRGDSAKRLPVGYATPTLPARMGIEPILGRGFLPTEGAPSDEPVVIISEGLWQRDLAGRPDVLGTTLSLADVHRTIIGVATSTSLYPRIDVWIPTPLDAAGTQPVTAVAWLRSGVSRNSLGVELTAAVVEPGWSDQGLELRLVPPDRRERASSISRVLILLWSASAFVLAIICANLATLLLARNLSRHRELSTCAALGASRIRIVRPLILECLVLGIAGGVLGIFVTAWGGQALLWLRPRSLSFVYPDTMPLDASVLAYTLTLTCIMGVVIGVLASARWIRTDVLRGAGRDESYFSGRHGSRRLSSAAVVVQTALAVMLVVGAALMLTSFLRLRSLDPG